MNKKQFTETLRNVVNTQFYQPINLAEHGLTIKQFEKINNFKFLSETELSDAIKQLKDFDINLLYDKKFWGLKPHESICAVATEPYQSLLRIKAAN